MLLSIVERGGMEIAQQMAKYTFDTKHMSAWKHAQLMIRGYQVQIQPTSSPLHCDLEHIHRRPSTKCVCVCVCVCVSVCVCVCVCVCDIYFKLYFASYAL